jgi:hypothetical protein
MVQALPNTQASMPVVLNSFFFWARSDKFIKPRIGYGTAMR